MCVAWHMHKLGPTGDVCSRENEHSTLSACIDVYGNTLNQLLLYTLGDPISLFQEPQLSSNAIYRRARCRTKCSHRSRSGINLRSSSVANIFSNNVLQLRRDDERLWSTDQAILCMTHRAARKNTSRSLSLLHCTHIVASP